MRCLYICEKTVTGEVDRDKMLTHLKEEAVAIPDKEERVEFVPGTIRGKQVTAHYILMYRVLFYSKIYQNTLYVSILIDFQYIPKMEEVQITKPKGEYDSDEEYEPPAVLHGRESVEREEREREFKEITESATLDDIKEIADILGVAYQV